MRESATLFTQVTELATVHNDLDQIICISKHLRTFALSGPVSASSFQMSGRNRNINQWPTDRLHTDQIVCLSICHSSH